MDNPENSAVNTQGICSNLPVELTVSVGQARPLVQDLMNATQGSVLPLDARVDEPVRLYLGAALVARGELIELDGEKQGCLAVKITEVVGAQGRGK